MTNIELNPGQQFIVDEAIKWYKNKNSPQVFQYDGPPGSGKSVVLNEIVRRLKLDPIRQIAAMSFIGSASLVMRMKGLLNAKTAHSWIYDVQEVPLRDKFGAVIYDEELGVPIKVPKFIPVDHLPNDIKLIVIDEGYSMPLKLRPDIEKFGIKILVCGDQNQLPPVNDMPAFLDKGKIYHLTQCMRQMGKDDINFICGRVNLGLPLLSGYYGNSMVIDYGDLTDDMLMWADAIICGTNKSRDFYNNRIRAILGKQADVPQYGEKVVCRNNNWLVEVRGDTGYKINLTNGLIGRVVNNPDVSSMGSGMFSMDFAPDLANVVFRDLRCNYKHMISDWNTRSTIKNNRYELGAKFEYAYAITAHIAQGSQFHKVVYIEEWMHKDIQTNVNLVGASRADTALIYVKMRQNF
jgi:exodeoxyribonuclease-5